MDFITVKCKWDFCNWQSKKLHVNHCKNEQKPSKLTLEMCIMFLYTSLVINYLFKQNALHQEVELGVLLYSQFTQTESFPKKPFKISME
jgi:hypothetical protein